MPNFSVGDEIIVVNSEGAYGRTQDGSTGTILSLDGNHAHIDFNYTPGRITPNPKYCKYTIQVAHIQLLTPESASTMLLRKIKFMWERQPYNQGKDHAIC